MKFALMKNVCPACGAALFSQAEMNDISLLRNRVANQEFSDDFDEVQIYDVAFFMFNELKSGIGQVFIQREIERIGAGRIIEEGDEAEDDHEVEASADEEIEDIREQVRKEKIKPKKKKRRIEISEDDVEEGVIFKPERETMEDKVSRLKRIARGNGGKTGAMVKRID
jgi:hypothetical protein